ncbi:hypothetical protein ACFCWG_48645 [Streptomyces sp. NPDC056390]|uniref:hypothetical protein n=1 Tax=Streptomyces sp. NPDC056390 TaxID=3345806 RepID=UPI0035D59BC8
MARGAASPADLQVVRELAERGVVVTASQLESWRRARGMVHLVAAIGLGVQKVGTDALAEAFALFG